jgi:hypothetical protein
MVKLPDVLEDLIGRKKEHMQWQEISRERTEPLAKAVKVYWETLGFKVKVFRRSDGHYSVFIFDSATRSREYGVPRPKRFTFFA